MKNTHLKALLSLLLLSATSTQAASILYTGEGDTTGATDQLTSDGSQNGTFVNSTVVNTDAKFGANAYGFDGTTPFFDKIDLGITGNSLGSTFTLAAFVKQSDNTTTRLFSNYSGTGSVNPLLFDFDLDNTSGNGLRLIVNGEGTTRTFGSNLSTGTYYHFAATYDNGTVKLYQNGVQLGADGTIESGGVTLVDNLFFGEDTGGTTDDNISGSADDILVYDQAMSGLQIQSLFDNGAVATLAAIPEPSTFILVAGCFLTAIMLKTRRRKC